MASDPPSDWFISLTPRDAPNDIKYYSLSDLYIRPTSRALSSGKCAGLIPGGLILGRKSSSPVTTSRKSEYDSPIISRNHAQLFVTPAGEVFVADLGSLHGTSVCALTPPDLTPVPKYSCIQVYDHEEIVLGREVQSTGKDYYAYQIRVSMRFPQLQSRKDDELERGRISMTSVSYDRAALTFASSADDKTLRDHISAVTGQYVYSPFTPVIDLAELDGGAKGVASEDEDVEYLSSHHPTPPGLSQQAALSVYDSDGEDRERDVQKKDTQPGTNHYGIPVSMLFDSDNDEEWPRGSSEEYNSEDDGSESRTDLDEDENQGEDEDEAPEVLSLHENKSQRNYSPSPVHSRAPISANSSFSESSSGSLDEIAELAEEERAWAAREIAAALEMAEEIQQEVDNLKVPTAIETGFKVESNREEAVDPEPAPAATPSGLGVWYSYTEDLEMSRPVRVSPGPIVFTPVKKEKEVATQAASPYYSPASPASPYPQIARVLRSPTGQPEDDQVDQASHRSESEVSTTPVDLALPDAPLSLEVQGTFEAISSDDDDHAHSDDDQSEVVEYSDEEETNEDEDGVSDENDEEEDYEEEDDYNEDEEEDEDEEGAESERADSESQYDWEEGYESEVAAPSPSPVVSSASQPIPTRNTSSHYKPFVPDLIQAETAATTPHSSDHQNFAVDTAAVTQQDEAGADGDVDAPAPTGPVRAEVGVQTTVPSTDVGYGAHEDADCPDPTAIVIPPTPAHTMMACDFRPDGTHIMRTHARTPSIGHSEASDTSTSFDGPTTPTTPLSRKRTLPEEFITAPEGEDHPDLGLVISSPSLSASAMIEQEVRPLKKQKSQRSISSTIGLVVLGAALGSVGTIAGLMQMAD